MTKRLRIQVGNGCGDTERTTSERVCCSCGDQLPGTTIWLIHKAGLEGTAPCPMPTASRRDSTGHARQSNRGKCTGHTAESPKARQDGNRGGNELDA